MPFLMDTHCRKTAGHAALFLIKQGGMLLLFCTFLLLSACSNEPRPVNDAASPTAAATPQDEAMETLKVLSAPAGLNTRRLFAEPASDERYRFDRLEREVQDLRDDFDLVSPAITRLVAVEQDMRDLMNQLETLIAAESPSASAMPQPADNINAGALSGQNEDFGENNDAPTLILNPEMADASPVTEIEREGSDAPVISAETEALLQERLDRINTAPDQSSGTVTAENPRTGDHADKTRVVVEISEKTAYSASMSSDSRQFILDLPQAVWKGERQSTAPLSKLVQGWSVTERTNDGIRLTFDLSSVSEIKSRMILPPRDNNYRIVVDLFSPDIHTPAP